MLPKRQETVSQTDLFKIILADLLNPRHELVLLVGKIDWQALDTAFGEFFTDGKGGARIADPVDRGAALFETRFSHSDEEVNANFDLTEGSYYN